MMLLFSVFFVAFESYKSATEESKLRRRYARNKTEMLPRYKVKTKR